MDIRIERVSKQYEGLAALQPTDLAIPSGQLIALLGPSGSGKTTLLRLIAGLLPVDSGYIAFGGRDASRLSLRERRVGFVFQHYALFPHMTVFENVAFGLRSRPRKQRPTDAAIRAKVDGLLDLVQIAELRERLPAQLSGGQRQRVALARAMAIDPTVLLLDEPFGALDAKVRIELRRWLRRLHDETGLTTVFVTHDQEEALDLADRVVVMNRGRIEQDTIPDEIYTTPASPFVYDFIGRSNQISGEVRDSFFHAPGLPAPLAGDGCVPGAATLYIRPQDLTLAATSGALQARVEDIRRLAGRITLEASLAGQARLLVLDLSSNDLLPLPARGDLVNLTLRRYRVFPATL